MTAHEMTPPDGDSAVLTEIMSGLKGRQKFLPAKLFYDERGSQLFDRICDLPEYYPTRTELGIMRACVEKLSHLIGPRASLIEFGSGSSLKTRILLEHLEDLAAYVPVDISRDHLFAAAGGVALDFPHIEVLPVAVDFTQPFPLPTPRVAPLRNLVYFPGSTIGNFTPDEAHHLLRVMHQEAGRDGALLIGVDLQKDRQTLERAYDDAEGVTAEFNLNMLRRINREFGADFDLDKFEHRAVYREDLGRIEMHLVSTIEQHVSLARVRVPLGRGEVIVTEYSHKYTVAGFAEMASRAGFAVEEVWVDPDGLFSVQYCSRP